MLREEDIAIELKCQGYECKTYMRNLEGTASVLIFESKRKTEDTASLTIGTIKTNGKERNMATTRLIALHTNKGKTPAQSLTERLDYIMNHDKTDNGLLISSYACAPQTAAMEFAHNRKTYHQRTGRYQQGEVICYHLRQSFKPGEITPEKANKIGFELAQRFFKGKHAFVVATHVGTRCVHSHIIADSITLDTDRKFKNFLGSGKALGRLSDQICLEHQLSVIRNPQYRDSGYGSINLLSFGASQESIMRLVSRGVAKALEKDHCAS